MEYSRLRWGKISTAIYFCPRLGKLSYDWVKFARYLIRGLKLKKTKKELNISLKINLSYVESLSVMDSPAHCVLTY